jgi:NADPH:quinone reductase-like Zn-dependent oxidoreductase
VGRNHKECFGTRRQFHAVDERIVGRKPGSLSATQAAALPLTSLTAWELLFDRLAVPCGRKIGDDAILIVNGAGGVGSILTQIARRLTGLTVITTASRPETIAWSKKMGAQHVIDHHKPLNEGLKEIGIPQVRYVAGLTATDMHQKAIVESLAPQGALAMIDDPQTFDIVPFKLKCLSVHWELMFSYGILDIKTDLPWLEASVQNGFKAIKIKIGAGDLANDVAIVSAARRTVGPDIRLMIDFNQSQTTASAIERIRRLEDFNLTWVEEPVAADDLAGHRVVRDRVSPVQIQTGENWWFRPKRAELPPRYGPAPALKVREGRRRGLTFFCHCAVTSLLNAIPQGKRRRPQKSGSTILTTLGRSTESRNTPEHLSSI